MTRDEPFCKKRIQKQKKNSLQSLVPQVVTLIITNIGTVYQFLYETYKWENKDPGNNMY